MTWISITAIAGASSILDSRLAYRKILKIKREGIGYDIVYSSTTDTRKVWFQRTQGRLRFASSVPFLSGEIIYVLIKNA